MGLRTTITSLLTSPLRPLLQARVRELTEQALEQRDLATPASVREVLSQLSDVQLRVHGLASECEALKAAIDSLPELLDPDAPAPTDELELRLSGLVDADASLEAKLEATHTALSSTNAQMTGLSQAVQDAIARIQATADRVLAVRGEADTALARLAKLSSPAAHQAPSQAAPAAKVLPAGDRGCQVDGCGSKHRARGFCGKHYQLWRRDNLAGFVGPKGRVFFQTDGPAWLLADAKPAVPVEQRGDDLFVAGERAEAQPAT